MLAAVHPYDHEEHVETSRTEFESIVRDGFYLEEATLEELPLDEVVEGVNRELDLMKSFPVYQAVPRSEVTGKIWSTRWCYRRKGPKQVSALRGDTVRKLPGCRLLQSHSWSRGHESVAWRWFCRKTSQFCSVTSVLLSEHAHA